MGYCRPVLFVVSIMLGVMQQGHMVSVLKISQYIRYIQL